MIKGYSKTNDEVFAFWLDLSRDIVIKEHLKFWNFCVIEIPDRSLQQGRYISMLAFYSMKWKMPLLVQLILVS